MATLESPFLIVDKDGRTEAGACAGPDELGHCPRVAWGDVVPCAGLELQPATATDGVWRLSVPATFTGCPVQSVRSPKRSVWLLAAMVAVMGAVAGAVVTIALSLMVTGVA